MIVNLNLISLLYTEIRARQIRSNYKIIDIYHWCHNLHVPSKGTSQGNS